MLKGLENLLRRFKDVRPSTAKPSEEPAPIPEAKSTPPDDTSDNKGATAEQTAPENSEAGDSQLKMASSRCDLHPLYPLRLTVIDILPPHSTATTKTRASCCTKATCNRHYIPEFGYFAFVAGEKPAVEGGKEKPMCDKHEAEYMVVTKLKGEFVWACPEPGCTKTVPYREPSES